MAKRLRAVWAAGALRGRHGRAPAAPAGGSEIRVPGSVGGPDWSRARHFGAAKRGAPMAIVLIPIPDRDFDPTEAAVSWQVLTATGHRVLFGTETGIPGTADDIMVTGRGLDA